jgi:hypothetical protein
VGNDSEILAAPAFETRFETLVRVSQAIAAHRDPKELFGVLVDDNRAVPCLSFFSEKLPLLTSRFWCAKKLAAC